jgi:outer membrane protein assembly factor BamD (BamD/ComL family)
VARFYWKKDLYHSALTRYLEILDKHRTFEDIRSEALARSVEAYERLAELLEKDPRSDAVVYFKGTTPAELRKRATELKANQTSKN